MCNLKKSLILKGFEWKIINNEATNTIIMPFVELDIGYKIHYLEKGKGKNLVFIHGFLGSSPNSHQ